MSNLTQLCLKIANDVSYMDIFYPTI